MKKTAVAVLSLVMGVTAGLILFTRILPSVLKNTPLVKPIINPIRESPEVVGFLPYWLIATGPLLGTFVAVLAAIYPAMRAARVV